MTRWNSIMGLKSFKGSYKVVRCCGKALVKLFKKTRPVDPSTRNINAGSISKKIANYKSGTRTALTGSSHGPEFY